jgi:SPP1 gp7 family putative phage head morphogenesis protein
VNQRLRDRLMARVALAVAGARFSERTPTPVVVQAGAPPEILLNAMNLPPKDAIAFMKRKGYKLTWSWNEMSGAAHARAFTVAKVMKLDILEDVRGMVEKAATDGITFREFRETLEPTLRAKGWWGKAPDSQVPADPGVQTPSTGAEVQLGSPWRLKTIFSTNVQSAYQTGHYKGMKAAAADMPWWQYLAVRDAVTRPEHLAMHGKIFRHNDPIWQTWYPPNGYNCRCTVRALEDSQIAQYGLSKDIQPQTNGTITDANGVQILPDEGFAYNPGEENLKIIEEIAAKKQAALQASLGPIKGLPPISLTGGFKTPSMKPVGGTMVPTVVATPEIKPEQTVQKPGSPAPFGLALQPPTLAPHDKPDVPSIIAGPVKPPAIDDAIENMTLDDIVAIEPTWRQKSKTKKLKFGGVIFDDQGRILLREPADHYDGYVWTFPKGGQDAGDTPHKTALREVAEETGHQGEVIGFVPGTHGYMRDNHFFLMRSTGQDISLMDKETKTTRWVTPAEAAALISQTKNKMGRARDLRVLAEAINAYNDLTAGRTSHANLAASAAAKRGSRVLPDIVPEPPVESAGWPTSVAGLKKVKSLGGSTGAVLVEDPATGQRYVMKTGPQRVGKAEAEAHLINEVNADDTYRALGFAVPECRLVDTPNGKVKLAKFVDGGRSFSEVMASRDDVLKKRVLEQVHAGFVTDALTGNWDVVGMSGDNILVDRDGKVWRIDNGGCFGFRAQGDRKTADEWNDYATELWSMRGRVTSAEKPVFGVAAHQVTSSAFEGVGAFELARQIERLDSSVLDSVPGMPADIRDTLKRRIAEMKHVAVKIREFEQDGWVETYPDDIAKHTMGARKWGVYRGMAGALTPDMTNLVDLLDDKGVPFDRCRTGRRQRIIGVAAPADPVIATLNEAYAGMVQFAKTVATHATDQKYNQVTLNKAVAIAAKISDIVTGQTPASPAQQSAAQYYLKAYASISSSMVTNTKPTVHIMEQVVPATHPPVAPAAPIQAATGAQPVDDGKSVVTRLSEYMATIGSNFRLVSDWADAQSGSTKSTASSGYRWLLLKNIQNSANIAFYNRPTQSCLASTLRHLGATEAEFELAMTIHHSFVQEQLAAMQFPGNDTTRRRIRLVRGERDAKVIPFNVGQTGVYPRDANASYSVIRPAGGWVRNAHVVVNAPHVRVTSLYFNERTPGAGGGFLLGNDENEATLMAHGLTAKRFASGRTVKPATQVGNDSRRWEV